MKSIALHILDIAQNSLRAGATCIRIAILERRSLDEYCIEMEDNGKGIPEELLPSVTDPFVTTRLSRKVGLGLPLFRQHALQTGGRLDIASEEGQGTKVTAHFSLRHIDRPPLGDMPGVIRILTFGNPGVRFVYRHSTESGEYLFDSEALRNELSPEELSNIKVQAYLKEMIMENLKEIDTA